MASREFMHASARRAALLGGVLALLLAAALATVARADVPAQGDFAPMIWSDKADYAPGELVTLSGAHWQPGESVHMSVNDDIGKTWSRDVDVVADAAGDLTDQFNLPDRFVASYSVRATGSSGAVATASFTDGNFRVQNPATTPSTAGASYKLENLGSNNPNCATAPAATGKDLAQGTLTGPGTSVQVGANGGEVVRITFSSPATGWTVDKYQSGPTTLTPNASGVVCHTLAADNNGTIIFDVTYKAATQNQTITFPAVGPKTYGDGDFDPGASASSGLPVSYASKTPGVCTIVNGNVHIVAAGLCTITASQPGNATYNPASLDNAYAIAKAPLSAKADDKTRAYGDDNPLLTGTLTGVKNGDPITASYSTPATQATGVGAHPIVPAINANAAVLANYQTPVLTNGTLTITKAPLSAKADDKTRAYGDDNPPLTGALTGVKNGDPITASYSTAADRTTGVGAHPIVPAINATAMVLANYQPPVLTNGTLSITKAELKVDAADRSKVYGDPAPALGFSLSGFKNGETIATAGVTGEAECSVAAGTGPGAGIYAGAITCAPGNGAGALGAANYSFVAGAKGTLTITRASLIATANDASREYGEANPAFTATVTGAKNGEAITATATSPATRATGVGKHPIVPAVQAASGVLDNYDITPVNGTLTILEAPLTATADDASREYGDANPAFTGRLTGVKNADPVTVDYSTVATEGSPVGAYAIVPAVQAAAGVLDNYAVTVGNGTLTIRKAPLTATVSDETVEYGDQARFSAGYAGFKVDDGAGVVAGTLSCAASTGSAGGPYPVTCSGLSAANYTIAYRGGSLTVTKAPLAVNANDAGMTYGGTAPALTATLSGFKNQEDGASAGVTGAPACAIAETAGPNAGTYPDAVTCGPGTLDAPNYRFVTGAKGTLRIAKADQAITFPPITEKTLGTPDLDPGATASSGLTVAYSAAPASVCTVVAGKVHLVGVGACTVTAIQGGSANYNPAAPQSRTFGVVYRWDGFFRPIENKDAAGNSVLNVAKSGSTIPVKFSLGGNQGLGVFWLDAGATVSAYPSSTAITCDSGAAQDAVEEYTAATSGLKYDPVADQYVYNWKTDATWAGKCRQLTVRLTDGTYHRANFKFAK